MTDYESITIESVDNVFIKIRCERSVAMELSEHFTFMVPGAKFMPAFKNKIWDGKIRLFNLANQTIYAGLLQAVEEFAKERDYTINYNGDFAQESFSLNEAREFIQTLSLTLEPRDYQIDSFVHAVRSKRTLLLSPTASGKSLMIYLLARFYNKKTLIVVPTTGLVHQLCSDFEEYGFDSDNNVHKIFSGQEKDNDKPITITTWQSIYKMKKQWFEQYEVVIGDEAHLFKANSLTSLMTKLTKAPYRFGFTGTLDGTQTNKLVLEGLFGAVKQVTTTSALIEQKHLASFKIKAIVLNYDDETRKLMKDSLYKDEIDFIVQNPKRNAFIKNLALSLEGNTLILYQFVEKQGRPLFDLIQKSAGERQVYFIHGDVDGEVRNDVRSEVETLNNGIIVASYGTFSTGVNIRNIHNIIFASPFKSKIKNLQSIGRGLRKSDTKDKAVLFDLVDDLSWKSKRNHTLKHFLARAEIYDSEKFDYKVYTVKLGG